MPASPVPEAPAAPLSSDLDRLRVLAAGVCALVLTVGLSRFAYTPLLPVMRQQAGLSYLWGGWLATLNYAGYIAGALIAVNARDLGQKFRLYRAGLVLAVISTAAMGLTTHVAAWAAWRFLAGLSSAAGMLLASGLVLDWLIRQGHRPWLGAHFAGLGGGIVVSGLAVVAMSGWLAWWQQWIGLAALGVLLFVPAWRWLPPPADAAAGARAAVPAPAPSRRWMGLMMASYFCAGFGYVVSATFIVAILEQIPGLTGHGGWVWIVLGLAATPSSALWDRVAARLGPIPALMVAYAMQCVSMLLPAWSDAIALNLAGVLLYGGSFVGVVSLTLTLVGRRFPQNPAKAMARLTLSYGVAQIVAPALAGGLAAAAGSYRGALFFAAGFMALGLGLLAALRRQDD